LKFAVLRGGRGSRLPGKTNDNSNVKSGGQECPPYTSTLQDDYFAAEESLAANSTKLLSSS